MKNVSNIEFGFNALKKLYQHPKLKDNPAIYFVDSTNELTTGDVNKVLIEIKKTNITYDIVVEIWGETIYNAFL
jgi:type II secretory pathway component HofQ